MNSPLQYLLVGFPYSGKSTLAKELVKKRNFVHINLDQLKFDRGYGHVGDDDVPDSIWEEIFHHADQLLVENLRKGKHVANEYVWVTKEGRARARKVAADAGFDTKVIYLSIPKTILKQRWIANDKSNARFQWSEEEFERYMHDFEPLTPDEQVLVYDQLLSVDRWIERNL